MLFLRQFEPQPIPANFTGKQIFFERVNQPCKLCVTSKCTFLSSLFQAVPRGLGAQA